MDYDIRRAEEELLLIQPDAVRSRLNETDCWHYRMAVPAFDFDVVVASHTNGLAVLQAVSSYDQHLAIALLEFVNNKAFVPEKLTVAEGFACAGYSFDRVTIIPPPAVRNFRG